jgi:pimeloyl-ACP methyl ester carboxylesterase
MKRKLLRLVLSLIKIAIVVMVLLVVLLFFFQSHLIYHPQPYRPDYKRLLPPRASEIEYNTACGRQVAFYVPPRSSDSPTTIPQRLWVAFGGNGSLALFWSDTVQQSPDPDAAFLLVDYPGYGKCSGSASPQSIEESSEAALCALSTHLQCEPAALDADINVLGHSLGAAAALQFAVHHPIKRAVLVAPFTTMRNMAKHVVGSALSVVLRHNYDNVARLQELAAREHPPEIIILHGDADPIIPVQMSRDLAAAFPRMIELHEITGADHVTVLDHVEQFLD